MLKNSEKFPILIGITCIPSSFPAKACKCSNDLYSGIKNNLSFLIWKTKTLAVISFLVIFHLPVIVLDLNRAISLPSKRREGKHMSPKPIQGYNIVYMKIWEPRALE